MIKLALRAVGVTALLSVLGAAPALLAQDAMMKKEAMTKDKMGADAMMAQHFVPYTDAAFAAAQKAGQPILVDIYADWCPVCKNQHLILDKLMSDPAYAKAVFLQVNYDTQKAAVKKFKAKSQSTLITFSGTKETGRIFYTADPAKITALAAKLKSS